MFVLRSPIWYDIGDTTRGRPTAMADNKKNPSIFDRWDEDEKSEIGFRIILINPAPEPDEDDEYRSQ